MEPRSFSAVNFLGVHSIRRNRVNSRLERACGPRARRISSTASIGGWPSAWLGTCLQFGVRASLRQDRSSPGEWRCRPRMLAIPDILQPPLSRILTHSTGHSPEPDDCSPRTKVRCWRRLPRRYFPRGYMAGGIGIRIVRSNDHRHAMQNLCHGPIKHVCVQSDTRLCSLWIGFN